MEHSEIVSRLEAVTGPDASTAGSLLESLLATYGAYSAGPSDAVAPRSYAERYAHWESEVESLYHQYDEAVRSLMTLALAVCHRYPDEATDARGNPIPEDLRGEPINETIRGYDTLTPLTVPAVGVSVAGHAHIVGHHLVAELNVFSTDSSDYDAAISAANDACHAYQSLRERPPNPGVTAPEGETLDSRAADYLRAKRQAEIFIEFLDAVE